MNRFEWEALLRAGVDLGLRPEEFWALTPAELAFLLGEGGGSAPLSRVRLEEMAAAFPDRIKGDQDDGT